jgi:hypothetical protein
MTALDKSPTGKTQPVEFAALLKISELSAQQSLDCINLGGKR